MAALVVLCLLMTHACRALNSGHVGVYRHCHPVSGTHIQVRGHACVLTEEVASPHQCPVFYCEQVTFSFILSPGKREIKSLASGPRARILILESTSRAQLHSLSLRER